MTTTDTDALKERIARAIHLDDLAAGEAEPWGADEYLMAWYRRNAAAVLPIVREAQAEAWEQGNRIGWSDCTLDTVAAPITITTNPYKEADR